MKKPSLKRKGAIKMAVLHKHDNVLQIDRFLPVAISTANCDCNH